MDIFLEYVRTFLPTFSYLGSTQNFVLSLTFECFNEPAQELHSRAAQSVVGNTTAQLVQPQGENPGGRQKEEKKEKKAGSTFIGFYRANGCIDVYT